MNKIIIFCLALFLSGCGLLEVNSYKADPISGKVIDKDTGKPLEDVHVVAQWELYRNDFVDNLEVQATKTDKDGNYRLPGFNYKTVIGKYLEGFSPQLHFYKPGYGSITLMNDSYQYKKYKNSLVERPVSSVIKTSEGNMSRSFWDGQTIKLNKFNKPEHVLGSLQGLNSSVHMILSGSGCESLIIQDLLRDFIKENEIAKKINKRYAPGISATNIYDRDCKKNVEEIIMKGK